MSFVTRFKLFKVKSAVQEELPAFRQMDISDCGASSDAQEPSPSQSHLNDAEPLSDLLGRTDDCCHDSSDDAENSEERISKEILEIFQIQKSVCQLASLVARELCSLSNAKAVSSKIFEHSCHISDVRKVFSECGSNCLKSKATSDWQPCGMPQHAALQYWQI